MFNRKSQIANRVRRAFTLVELLLVIAIIGLLMGLLVPAVSKVRVAGQKVATQGLINRLTQACEAYFQDFNAYPGPFAEDEVVNSVMTASTVKTLIPQLGGQDLKFIDPPGSTTYVKFDHAPTSSENLFLGLCGGLRYDPSGPNFLYDEELAKRAPGPMGLSMGVAKKAQSYFQITTGDISSNGETSNPLNSATGPTTPGLWWDASNGYAFQANFLGDSRIYEFVDTFKVRRPILYMRANRGVNRTGATSTNRTGFIFDPNVAAAQVTPYQYNPTQIQYAYSSMGTRFNPVTNVTENLTAAVWHAFEKDFSEVKDDTGTVTKFNAGDERYFVNEQVSTGNPAANAARTLVPQQKDKFVLISAGADGIYGTADDIRN